MSVGVEQEVGLGEAVRAHRERAGLSLTQLAIRAGIHRNTIWNIEQGKEPQWGVLCRIARALGLTVAQLITPPGQ